MRRSTALVSLALSLVASQAHAVSTTLLISEFRFRGSSGAGDEFIEIYNASNQDIDVSGYKVNGSNAGGSISTRVTISSGTIIKAKGFLLFTQSAAPGYSGPVTGDQTYNTGVTDDGGVALLTPANVIVDAVGLSSGSAYKEGTTLPSLGSSNSDKGYRRKGGNCAPAQDTDNNNNDFEQVSPTAPQRSGMCCLDTQCATPPAGQCYPANGTCDTAKGTCSYAIQPGKTCDDGNACTETDVCLANGACQGATKSCNSPPAPVCVNGNTAQRAYTTPGSCSSGACDYAFVDTSCSCNPATGLCQDPCANVVCNTPPNAQCYQAAGVCNNGSCSYTKKNVGTACDDGVACTTGDACDTAGACTGTPKVCTPPAPTCVGNASRVFSGGTCDAGNGSCSFSQTDTACDFGCDGATGLCKPNPCAGITCATPPSACYQTIGFCDPQLAQCVYQPKSAGTACDDGVACTENDTCNGAGTCSGAAKVCTPPAPTCVGNASRVFSGGTCDQGGACSFTQTDKPCANGCDGATGLCKNDPCAAVSCNTPPSQCHQPTGTCTGGVCSYALKPANASCDDSDPCTIADRCSDTGACAGSSVVCNQPPSPSCKNNKVSITYNPVGTCGGGTCSYTSNETDCAFGCDLASGLCAGDLCAGVSCESPPSQCHAPIGTCAGGVCSYALKPVNASCDDQDTCTSNDACDDQGVCKGTAKVCNTPPDSCHAAVGTCSDGACTYAPLQAGAACNDSDPCTTGDACDDQGACKGAPKVCNTPPDPECSDAKTSQSAQPIGACSPIDGACGYDVVSTPCAAGCDLVTGLCKEDPCLTVTCDKPPSQCHVDAGTCASGTCSYPLKAANSPCDDGDDCTENDACDDQGACKGNDTCGSAGKAGAAGAGGAGAAGKAGAGGAGKAGAGGKAGGAGKAGAGGSAAGSAGSGGAAAGQGGAGAAGAPAIEEPVANAPGCGCAVPGQSQTPAAPQAALAALALAAAASRRRRQR